MKLFWFVYMLQTCIIFSHQTKSQLIRNTIRKTFGYDCKKRPKIGQILFWKISTRLNDKCCANILEVFTIPKKLKPQKYIRGITQFQSNETYFILTKINIFRTYIFYWLGSQATLDDKKEAAKYTIRRYLQLQEYYRLTFYLSRLSIFREREAIESELFKHVITLPEETITENYHLYDYYLGTGILVTHPNLYVIRGSGDVSHMKKVSIGTFWLKNDTCMILKTRYSADGDLTLFKYCGITASEETYNRAKYFALLLQNLYRRFLALHLQIKDHNEYPQFKFFIELLEDKIYYKPNEVDNSNDHLLSPEAFLNERDKRISLYKISSEPDSNDNDSSSVIMESGLQKKEITERPLLYRDYRLHLANYILNTNSISGVFVHFGSYVLEEAEITMQHAEEYVHNIESNFLGPVPLHIDGSIIPNITVSAINLKINFIDFPLLIGLE